MRFSPTALFNGASEMLKDLSVEDVPPVFDEAARSGWDTDDGAVLLRAFRDGYHGDRGSFTGITDYEMAVNGRAIPDFDLDNTDPVAIRTMLRRGVAFAWEALRMSQNDDIEANLEAYVTITPTLFDPNRVTGNVTFCSVEAGMGHCFGLDQVRDIAVSLEADECTEPLPGAMR